MYKKFIGVILAKKNSQRLRNKNLVKIGNKHLVEYPMKSFNKSKYISRFILSSDSKQILSLGEKYKKCFPQHRPKKYSLAKSESIDSLIYIIEQNNLSDDTYLILLEPTSPLTTYKDINRSIELLRKKKKLALVSVGKCKSAHPQYCFEISPKKHVRKKIKLPLRQKIKEYFYLDGSIYISRISELKKFKTFLHKKTFCYEFNKTKNFEIDDLEDLKIIKKLFNQK